MKRRNILVRAFGVLPGEKRLLSAGLYFLGRKGIERVDEIDIENCAGRVRLQT